MLMVREEIVRELLPYVGSRVGVEIDKDISFKFEIKSGDDLIKEIISKSQGVDIDSEVIIHKLQGLDPVRLTLSDLSIIGNWFDYGPDEIDGTQEKIDKINEILSTCYKQVELSAGDCDEIVEFTLASVYITEDMLGKYSESKSITVGGN